MQDTTARKLSGRAILAVEDDYLVAADLACALEDAGALVVGPLPSVQEAIDLLESNASTVDAAVIDINLGGERAYPLADALALRGIPFVFATGYDVSAIPPQYAAAPRCEKPLDKKRLLKLLETSLDKKQWTMASPSSTAAE
jgi:DNA-binding NtrC family response regulator